MSLQCHLYPNSMIHQGIKDQVQYKVTEMQENVVEMGYVIYKVLMLYPSLPLYLLYCLLWGVGQFSSPLSTSERLDCF